MTLSNSTSKFPKSSLGPHYYPRLLILFLATLFSILGTAFGWNALVQERKDEAKLRSCLIPGFQVQTTDIFVTTLISAAVLLLISLFTLACLCLSLYARTKDLSTRTVRVQVVFLTLGALCLLGAMVPYLIIFNTHHVGIIVPTHKGTSGVSVDGLLSGTGAPPIPNQNGSDAEGVPLAGQLVGSESTSIFTNPFNRDITTVPLHSLNLNLLKLYREIPYLIQFAVIPCLAIVANLLAAGVLFYQTWDKDVDESELRGLGFDFGSPKDSDGSSSLSHRPLMVERASGIGRG